MFKRCIHYDHDESCGWEFCLEYNCPSFKGYVSADSISEIKYKFNEFIEKQKDIPQEYVDIINKNFWDLI